MSATTDNAQTKVEAEGTGRIKPIDIGFRWIDEITIELKNGRPNAKLQLKVTADTGTQKYGFREGKQSIIRPVMHQRIPCNETKEPVIELIECRRKKIFWKDKVPIFSMRISLGDDELYTNKIQANDESGATVTITFAYTPGGGLRNRVENARRITEEQKVVLDKIKHVHRFFQVLEKLSDTVEDMHPHIKAASTAILSLYKLCEKQKECRDAARDLVDQMDTFLSSGAEVLSGALRTNSATKVAFRSLAVVIEDVCKFIEENSKGIAASLLRGALSASYESRLKELKEKLTQAKESMRDSLNFGTWKRVLRADLRDKLKIVSEAHYSPGEGCLENTRKALLANVDTWLQRAGNEKMAWIHGHAGSGKSALLNSIAEGLERARIPFTCFPCRRDDPDLSNIHKILSTIAYIFAEFYGDYSGLLSDLVDQPAGRSVLTGDIKKQNELLFGEEYEFISPKGAKRPPIHIILIDALDECRNHRDGSKPTNERRALLTLLIDLAYTVPWIKILITSRPETDIVDAFSKSTSAIHRININDDKWETSTDIRLFVEAQSRELELDLSPDQVERFQIKASGLFIWCTTVFRFIQESKERWDTVDSILNDQPPDPNDDPHAPLYFLYKRVLSSAVSRSQDKELMDSILSIIFVTATRRPLSAEAIADILYPNEEGEGLRRKRGWVKNIVRSLSAIIYVEEGTGVVRVCHPSVLDFIGGMLTGRLSITPAVPDEGTARPFSAQFQEIHMRVFNGCFTIMNRDLRFNICGLEDSPRLNKDIPDLHDRIAEHITEVLQYGSLFWLSHLEESDLEGSDAQVLAFLNSPKTLYWVEALSLMDVVDRGIVILQDCARLFANQPNITEISGDWERFLLAYGDASKSIPHLYLSALSWLPDSSHLWNIVRSSFSPELPLISNVPGAWNSERWSENVGSVVMGVAYSADGHLIAAGCRDGRVRLWEARSGKIAREPFKSESWIRSIAFSRDNRWLASGHGDGNVRLWDLRANSAEPRVLKGHNDCVHSVGFSSDSKQMVSGSDDKSIRVWNVDEGTAIGVPFTGHDRHITSVTFSADDTRIISGSYDNTVRIWNSETGEQIGVPLQGHSWHVNSVACSRDGRFIASCSVDKTIILWDAQTYEQIGHPLTNYHTGYIWSVCFSADSKYLASGCDNHSINIWNVETRSLVCDLRGHTGRVFSVAFSPDGQDVISGSLDNTVRIWNPKETASADKPSTSSTASVTCVSYIPNSSLIASASSDGRVYLWDTHTGAAVGNPMQGHTIEARTLAVSSDGLWLVSGSRDKTLRLWDIASGTPLGEPILGHRSKINSVAVSPDNRLIASASSDKTVRLWNVATHQLIMTLDGHEEEVTSVTFAVDGNRVISSSRDRTIRMWDTRAGEAVGHPLKGHEFGVTTLAVSPDGQWIASASWDTTRIWSMTTLSVVHVLNVQSDSAQSVAFSRDSQFLISGSSKEVKVWNVLAGDALGDPLSGHTGLIHTTACSPDGHEFASGSSDGTVRIWDARARTDLVMYRESEADYAELDEEASRVCWNTSRASTGEDDDWIKDGEKLLLWVPVQYRCDMKNGLKLVIEARGKATVSPNVDYRKLLRFSGPRWKDVYTSSEPNERAVVTVVGQ